MKLSDIITEVRRQVADTSTENNDWSDAEIGAALHTQHMILVRRMAALDESWNNCRISFTNTGGVISDDTGIVPTQDSANGWRYILPSWVMRVSQVSIARNDAQNLGEVLAPLPKSGTDAVRGWRHDNFRSILLKGYSVAQEIELEVAKRPARLTRGTLPAQTSMAANQVRIDLDSSADAAEFPHEVEQGSYVNCLVELNGEVQRCISSEHRVNFGGNDYTVLTMMKDWDIAPAADDTYELHAEIPDEHTRLLVLLIARQLWMRKGNRDELTAMGQELAQEWQEFIDHIQPREIQRPKVLRTEIDNPPRIYPSADGSEDLWL